MPINDSSFFLTKSAANLAQKLQYHFEHAKKAITFSAASGVGKTVFIHFLLRNRFSDYEVVWLEIFSKQALAECVKGIDKNNSDLFLVIDQIEECSPELMAEMFSVLSSIKGHVIFIAKTSFLATWSSACQGHNFETSYFSLQPMTDGEALHFVKYKAKQKFAINDAAIPFTFRLKINRCKGNFRQIKSLLSVNEDVIRQFKQGSSVKNHNDQRVWISLGLMAVVIGFWLLPSNNTNLDFFLSLNEAQSVEKIKRAAKMSTPVFDVVNEERLKPKQVIPDVKEIEVSEPKLEPIADDIVELKIEQDAQIPSIIEGNALSIDSPLTKSSVVVKTGSLLETKLAETMQWLLTAKDTEWTHQILVFAATEHSHLQFKSYIDSLLRKGINVESIRVYEFTSENRHSYSILYGLYESKAEARQAKKEMHLFLKKDNSVLRSAKGIREETNQNKVE